MQTLTIVMGPTATGKTYYIDKIREAVDDVTIEIYVMSSSQSQWRTNIANRKLEDF